MRRIVFLLLFFFIVSVITPAALELSDGKVKFVLHENLGRFSLYYLTDVRNNRYTPLFLEEDPRTTFLTILEGNNTYRMGEAVGFSQTTNQTNNSAQFVWESNTLKVTQDFSFISSSSSAVSDGIMITITVENITEKDIWVGARYVFDTYLGEKDNTHFFTSENGQITRERDFSAPAMPRFIVSAQEEISPGFQIMLNGQGITVPERCVCANWKRLNDSGWEYDVKKNRNFNHLPYSINDSALCLYYDVQEIERGKKRTLSIAMGHYTPEGYQAVSREKKTAISDVFTRALKTDSQFGNVDNAIKEDLLTVRELIKEINQILESDSTVTESELEVMNQVIEELKKHKSNYEDR